MNSLAALTLQDLIFYFLSGIMLLSALMVVSTRHTVRGVLFLILAFIASAGLWLLLESEFLALVLIFVYVGAVMTLFLFVVMMLNLQKNPAGRNTLIYFLIGLFVAGLLAFLMLHGFGLDYFNSANYPNPPLKPADYSNTQALGAVLYTDYVLAFELAAVILLVAIIGAIGIAFRGTRPGTQTQNVAEQLQADPKERLRLVNMKPEKRL